MHMTSIYSIAFLNSWIQPHNAYLGLHQIRAEDFESLRPITNQMLEDYINSAPQSGAGVHVTWDNSTSVRGTWSKRFIVRHYNTYNINTSCNPRYFVSYF